MTELVHSPGAATRLGDVETQLSPLLEMTQTTPTCLWNDSASPEELAYAIQHGAVGATCNPVIALSILKNEMPSWRQRIAALLQELPQATEDDIAWKLVEELSVRAARMLERIFDAHRGRNGRVSIQTDPRRFRSASLIVDQAVAFSRLAPNMVVKIPVTRAGIPAIEEAPTEGSASTPPYVSRSRSAWPWARRWSEDCGEERARARPSPTWDRSARSWSAASTIG